MASERKPLKVIDVSGLKTVFKGYRLVPYPEIEKILRNGGEAFVEGVNRKTAWSAAKILSGKAGFPVKAEKRVIVSDINEEKGLIEGIEGYIFRKKASS